MRFAVFTASTPDWPPDEAARRVAAAGYDGIEWRVVDQPGGGPVSFWANNLSTWPATGVLNRIDEIRAVTDGAGLAMSALGSYARHDQPDYVETMFATAQALGIDRMRVCVANLAEDGKPSYPAQFDAARRDLRTIDSLAQEYGVKALVELHMRTLASSASAALRLLDGFDPERWGVIHDLGNLVVEGGEDLLAGMQMLGPYLAHAHVKNARWVRDDDGAWSWEWAPLADGQGDVAAWLRALRAVGYDDWITVEDFSTDVPADQRIRDNLTWLRAQWEATA